VADWLGDTPAVARGSYIDPRPDRPLRIRRLSARHSPGPGRPAPPPEKPRPPSLPCWRREGTRRACPETRLRPLRHHRHPRSGRAGPAGTS
jgi:hypothetical protein